MTKSDLEHEWKAQLFAVRRSIRYHQRRRAFFDRLDQFGNMLAVVLGSTAIYGMLETNSKTLALTATALVTVLSAVNLVFGSVQKARAHADFSRQFIALEKRFLDDPSPERLREVIDARLSIEAEEPPILRVLDSICHNEQLRAEGYPKEYFATIRYWQRWFAQLFDVFPSLIAPPHSHA